MRHRYYFPLDPKCPAVAGHTSADDEAARTFARRHRQACPRCQAYGVANVETEPIPRAA
jgi:hypothetical protein